MAAIMREAIRLSPTAPLRVVSANEDITIGGGKYFIPAGGAVVINTEMAQRDPKVWGEDVGVYTFVLVRKLIIKPPVSRVPSGTYA